jgi:hypothetical protein
MTDHHAFDAAVRHAIYDHFARTARAPSVADAASALHCSRDDVAAAYRRLAAGRAIALRDDTTDILMAHPFSAIETPFRVAVHGREYSPNCAWDALGIAAVFDGEGAIEGECADCLAPLRIGVRAGILHSDPLRMHFAVPPRNWWTDIEFT